MDFIGTRILETARDRGVAVAGFDAFNMESAQAVVMAANELSLSVLLQVGVDSANYMGLKTAVETLRSAKAHAMVDVCLHFDHGRETSRVEQLAEVVELGIESLMVDGSALPIEDNINLTRQVVGLAHPRGISVEAEVGRVSRDPHATPDEIRRIMTQPDQAARLMEESGADYLAVSVGSISGQLDTHSTLDLERLQQIRDKVDAPLVFHGGTGIPEDQLRDAIRIGVAKVNIAHGFRNAFLDGVRQHLAGEPAEFDPRVALAAGTESAKSFAMQRMRLMVAR